MPLSKLRLMFAEHMSHTSSSLVFDIWYQGITLLLLGIIFIMISIKSYTLYYLSGTLLCTPVNWFAVISLFV